VLPFTDPQEEVLSWLSRSDTKRSAFSSMSKRRHGYPSETRVKRGDRVVHGDKEFIRETWAAGSLSMWFWTPLSRTAA
jgi:hypothetical protein